LIQLNHNGQAILLITHDDKLVCRYAGRIILLAEGRIVAEHHNGQRAQAQQIRDFEFHDSLIR
ncbi:MAG: hypothetical protein GTN71_03460, partial [Anaerolineae bacterium]|nr:hypothetical protein [Anaerolineae bacterium]